MLRNFNKFGKSTVLVVFITRNTQHPATIAQVNVSPATIKTGAAIHGGVKGLPLARLDFVNI